MKFRPAFILLCLLGFLMPAVCAQTLPPSEPQPGPSSNGSFMTPQLEAQLLACDLCGCSMVPNSLQSQLERGWRLGVSEQYTHFGRIFVDGNKISNTANQSMDSSTTQFLVSYNFSKKVGLQLSLPYIHRSYRRAASGGVENGTEQGLGDLSLRARYTPLAKFSDDSAFVASLHGGLKLPTGNPSRINEELAEGEEDADSVPSAIHGHDLALGSGSVDGLLGADVLWRSGSFLVTAGAEYNLRTRGHAGYQYANDFQWNVAPGFYLLHKDGRLAGLQLRLAGESKGKDNLSGVTAEDTGINSLYLGPQFSWSSPELVGQFGLDLPVSIENTALQSVPSYRLRFYLSRRF